MILVGLLLFLGLWWIGRVAIDTIERSRLLGSSQRFTFLRWQFINRLSEPYLTKLYIVRTPLFQDALHWIHSSDRDRDMHDHPRDFVSIVLRGGYLEARPSPAATSWKAVGTAAFPEPDVYLTERRRWSVAYRRAADPHRIVHVEPHTLTLVLWGRKKREWGFHTPWGWRHWRTYLGVEEASQ